MGKKLRRDGIPLDPTSNFRLSSSLELGVCEFQSVQYTVELTAPEVQRRELSKKTAQIALRSETSTG